MYETREFFHAHDIHDAHQTYGDQGMTGYESQSGGGFSSGGGFVSGATHYDGVTHYDTPYPPPPGMEPPANTWEFEAGLAQLLEGSADEPARSGMRDEPVAGRPPVDRRRRRIRPRLIPPRHLSSLVIAALTAAIVAMVSVLGGVIAYHPLCHLASPTSSDGLAGWWPLLVYGPWLAASLSILRAALHRHRAVHSWVVVVLFSTIAVFLCVIASPRSLTGMAVAGLPPITALVSFHQLVRQITLIDLPRHALPQQRGAGQGTSERLAHGTPSGNGPMGRSGGGSVARSRR